MVAKFYYMLVLQILAKFISVLHLYLFKRAWFIIYISISFFINDVASFAQDKSEFILTNIMILCSIRKCFLFFKKWKAFPPFPCAITFSSPLCYCHDYHYCHHCHHTTTTTTTTTDIEENGVLLFLFNKCIPIYLLIWIMMLILQT